MPSAPAPSLLCALDGHIMLSSSLVMPLFPLVPCMVSPLWIISDMIVEANLTFLPLLAFESSVHLTILSSSPPLTSYLRCINHPRLLLVSSPIVKYSSQIGDIPLLNNIPHLLYNLPRVPISLIFLDIPVHTTRSSDSWFVLPLACTNRVS